MHPKKIPQGNQRLCHFIRQNLASITEEWIGFAESITSQPLSYLQLRDHIHEILFFIADDIESVNQTPQEQLDKSRGKNKPKRDSVGSIHGTLRYDIGFNLVQMIMEYRALRASIIKLWVHSRTKFVDADLEDMIRFNEAIDEVLADSVTYFMEKHPSRDDL